MLGDMFFLNESPQCFLFSGEEEENTFRVRKSGRKGRSNTYLDFLLELQVSHHELHNMFFQLRVILWKRIFIVSPFLHVKKKKEKEKKEKKRKRKEKRKSGQWPASKRAKKGRPNLIREHLGIRLGRSAHLLCKDKRDQSRVEVAEWADSE